ncbi:MAG: hypothetical protein II996_02230 [Oscillospiraceae bacterium]|nr:hypothetical protein [Clostridia bacterium]MBQ4544375.1 hypothetical protein [Oscillospiraceae bacterium]
MSSGVFAADAEKTSAADTLYSYGLFDETGIDSNGRPVYELDRAPN